MIVEWNGKSIRTGNAPLRLSTVPLDLIPALTDLLELELAHVPHVLVVLAVDLAARGQVLVLQRLQLVAVQHLLELDLLVAPRVDAP